MKDEGGQYEVSIYLVGGGFVFRGTFEEVRKVRERYINQYVSVSGMRKLEK